MRAEPTCSSSEFRNKARNQMKNKRKYIGNEYNMSEERMSRLSSLKVGK